MQRRWRYSLRVDVFLACHVRLIPNENIITSLQEPIRIPGSAYGRFQKGWFNVTNIITQRLIMLITFVIVLSRRRQLLGSMR